MYAVVGLKKFKDSEGSSRYMGHLMLEGCRIGTWAEYSGGTRFFFKDPSLEADFKEWAKSQPEGKPARVISNMVAELDEDKKFAEICKVKIMIRVPSDPVGEYRTYKFNYEPKFDAIIHTKFPEAEIINRRFL